MEKAMDEGGESFGTTVNLLRSARSGDREALDSLFKRYLPRVRQIVAIRTGQRLRELEDLEDLVQGHSR